MKSLASLLAFVFSISYVSFGQTGPGGVGDNTSNGIWLRAGDINQANSTVVATWADASGNGNDAVQGTGGIQPLYFTTSALNGQPIVRLDGTDDEMAIADAAILDGTSGITYFAVLRPNNLNGNPRGILGKRIAFTTASEYAYTWFFHGSNRLNLDIHTQNNRFNTGANTYSNATNYVFAFDYDGTLASARRSRMYGNGVKHAQSSESSAALPNSNQPVAIGALNVGYGTYLGADYAEIIHYNYSLDTVEHIIVNNYLAAKYGISLGANDLYDEDNGANGDYDFDVAGIGRFDAAREHNDAQGSGIVRISNPSDLNDNEFMFWGHNGGVQQATETTDIPVGVDARFDREWRVSEVNFSSTAVDVGSVNISWDLNGLGSVTASDLRLLIDTDNDGLFADETPIAGAIDLGGGVYQFAGESGLSNNLRFTLATINSNQTPLPVELLSFNAINNTSSIDLVWKTASEQNNSHFEVQRSSDLNEWQTVGMVDGAGNASHVIEYSLTDYSPIIGRAYYRLQQFDFNGGSEYSHIVSTLVSDNNLDSDFSLYPNPANNEVIISFDNDSSDKPHIYDLLGKEVMINPSMYSVSSRQIRMDISNLPTGTYLVKIGNHCKMLAIE